MSERKRRGKKENWAIRGKVVYTERREKWGYYIVRGIAKERERKKGNRHAENNLFQIENQNY